MLPVVLAPRQINSELIGEGWPHARKYFSLSEKYTKWGDYRQPARGFGIHAYAHKVHRPIRLRRGGHVTNQRQFRHLGITPRITRSRLAPPRWGVRVVSVAMSRV